MEGGGGFVEVGRGEGVDVAGYVGRGYYFFAEKEGAGG